ncbi:NAD(+) diphosphatase [filamentous cyanobacterium CCP5]|nr:NAD(+) diphosphatase [filamentous cyanobacterium CCP5]
MPFHFVPGIHPPNPQADNESTGSAWWFVFIGRQLVLQQATLTPLQVRALAPLGLDARRTQYLGQLNGQPCYGAELPEDSVLPPQLVARELRSLYGVLANDWLDLAGLAFQILEWDRTHQFCGHCGTPTQAAAAERAKRCPSCGLSQYPRISPAMIVLISRGDDILLGRAPRFRPGMYSLIAGYVESHESLEACVVREVQEEVGIEVANIRYWGSQPWPYPHTLMVGFTADYAGGDIVVDPHELTDARWFAKHQLPDLPSEASIARKMINWFVGQS